jgi:hypothetical protein
MPIVLTPVPEPVSSTIQCVDQISATPKVTRVEGVEVWQKRQAVLAVQGQESVVNFTMRNVDGAPVDLTACLLATQIVETTSGQSSQSSSSLPYSSSTTFEQAGGRILVRMLEALSLHSCSVPYEVEGSAPTPGTGHIRFTLPADVVALPGVYVFEAALLDSGDGLLFSNKGYLFVERGLFGPVRTSGGPYTLQEIRLALRDSGPEDNYMLASEEFDLAEICSSVIRPVEIWNEAQPPIRKKYNTTTYPFRRQWMLGTKAELYKIAAAHYRREDLPISAAGIQVDDKKKAMEYETIGDRLLKEYERWVRDKKVSLNAEACFGRVGLLLDEA